VTFSKSVGTLAAALLMMLGLTPAAAFATSGPAASATTAMPRSTVAASYDVNQLADEVDIAIGDQICRTASGRCSIRAAIQEANATDGHDTIRMQWLSDPQGGQGVYVLSRTGMFENGAATGDLDITGELTILGLGTTIDGGGIDRVLHVVGQALVTIDSLSIRGGRLAEGYGDGGGILVSGGAVSLTNSTVYGNSSAGRGGGIHVTAGASITTASQTRIRENNGGIGGGMSGAAGSTVSLNNYTLINHNTAAFGGGVSTAGTLLIRGAGINQNTALASGGGVWATGALYAVNGAFYRNTAADFGGGIGAQGPTIIIRSGINENAAKYGGGIAIGGTATIAKSLINANRVTPGGYATELFNVGDLTVNTSQIDASASTMASAIFNGGSSWNRRGTLTINDTTIASVGRASTIRNDLDAGPLTLTNTIIESSVDPAFPSNPAGACAGSISTGVITSGGYNLVSDGTCQFTQIGDEQNVRTQLGPLTYTGVTLSARFPGPPAIGTGQPGCSGTDYRGLPRPQSGSCDKGSIDV